jgi:Family of unknown function (DUF5947)
VTAGGQVATGAYRSGAAGLRRFVKRAPGAAAPAAAGSHAGPGTLASAEARGSRTDRGSDPAAGAERCEMCAEVVGDRHGHVVDTEKRSLVCACRACYLLFTQSGAGGGRYRAVPECVYHDPERPLTEADWNELQIPVAMAFFFFNSALGRVVAGYPSPGGATECELDLAAWDRLAAAYPLLAALTPDVEAIFVNRSAGPAGLGGTTPPGPPARGDPSLRTPPEPPGIPPSLKGNPPLQSARAPLGPPPAPQNLGGNPSPQTAPASLGLPQAAPSRFEVFLIPIDECYSLVGELRLHWQGFDGGADARAALAAFLDSVRRRALTLERRGAGPTAAHEAGPP